ncbi:MAG: eukaryotic-like serine/threonine-protein kinase [Solirubrobacterales bacterium]|jgi:serine/threonine-protein kinase|nr:eukaryotic-like serine/threonine-protein kinase [Solirubrobacterales bacterium]
MIGTVLSGRYKLEAKLGSGGMSTVYLARDTTLDRQVAVKVLHREMSEQEDQLQRFRQEARAVAKLSHPNVVAVIDAGEDGGHPYIVFEYVEGETLKQRINRVGALDPQEALAYAIEIARGLTVAHNRNMVHRDIKPQNVLIDAEGRAKLTDFGISRQLEQDGMTATGRVLGTTDYVAPEQAMGHPVDQRSDIYSLGVVLYEMLIGQVPFHADSQVGVAMKHVNEELPDVQQRRPELSAAAAMVVERATAKDPDQRYQQVGELIDDLSTALEVEAARAGGTTGEATSVLDAVAPDERKLSGGHGRRSWLAIGLIVIVGAAILLAVQLIGSGNGPGGGGALKGKGSSVALAEASDYDPQGDDSEDPEAVSLAVDGNPTTTAWSSEHYDTEDFAGTKTGPNPGVGLYVVSKSTTTPSEMLVRSPSPGWDAEIYASPSGPPEELSEWGEPVGEVSDAEKNEEVELHLGSPAKYFLLWFTKAAPSQEQEGRYQVEISDVKLID